MSQPDTYFVIHAKDDPTPRKYAEVPLPILVVEDLSPIQRLQSVHQAHGYQSHEQCKGHENHPTMHRYQVIDLLAQATPIGGIDRSVCPVLKKLLGGARAFGEAATTGTRAKVCLELGGGK